MLLESGGNTAKSQSSSKVSAKGVGSSNGKHAVDMGSHAFSVI